MLAAFQNFEQKIRNAERQLAEIEQRRQQAKQVALSEIQQLKEKAISTTASGPASQPKTAPKYPHSSPKAILKGHTDSVNCIILVPAVDGVCESKLVSGSSDGAIRVWNINNWKCEVVVKCGEIPGSDDEVFCLTSFVAEDGKVKLVAGLPGTIKVWDFETFQCEKVLEDVHEKDISGFQFVRIPGVDRRLLASASLDNHIKIWDIADWTCLRDFSDHDDCVLAIVAFNGGASLASASDDSTIRIWDFSQVDSVEKLKDPNQNLCTQVLRDHTDYISDLAVVVCGAPPNATKPAKPAKRKTKPAKSGTSTNPHTELTEKLVSASGDFTVKVWNTKSWVCEKTLEKGNIANRIASSDNLLIVPSLRESSDYEQCCLNVWVSMNDKWMARDRTPTIPAPKFILVKDLTPPSEAKSMKHLVIATSEADPSTPGSHPVFVWSGGGPPQPVATQQLPSSAPSEREPGASQQPPVPAQTGRIPADDTPMKTDRPELESKETQPPPRDEAPSSLASLSKKRKLQEDTGRAETETPPGVGDRLVRELVRPMLAIPNISSDMRELLRKIVG